MYDDPKNYSYLLKQQIIYTDCPPPHSRMFHYISSYLSTHYVNNNFGGVKIFYLQRLRASSYNPKGAAEGYCSEQEAEALSAHFPTLRNTSFNTPPLLVNFIVVPA
jgi:hypothetical protein